jgi:hypothetical protein
VSGRGRRAIREGDWRIARDRSRAHVTDGQLDALVEQTVQAIAARARTARLAYAWAGGKNSQVLAWLMTRAGVHDAVLGVTAGLEWPAMTAWRAAHLPLGCAVYTVPVGLGWLAAHPHLLFPPGSYLPAWSAAVAHRAQDRYFHREALDVLAVGRRRVEGHHTGPPGAACYTNADGVTRWSPIAHWTHEQVFALIDREDIALPPCYRWPRGFEVGTGAWAARPWTARAADGFAECWAIDATVVRAAARVLAPAADWMRATGRT